MEIPFYTSFKEFKDNYRADLEKWLSIYPDGDEMDYLGCVYERYSDYAVTDISGITIDEPYYKDKTVWVEVKPNNVPKYYWNLQGKYCADEEGSVFERLSFTRVFEIINNRFREIDKYYIENYSNSYKFFHHNVKQIYDEPYHNYNSAGRNDDYIITKKIETDLGECIEFIDLDISGYDIPSGMFNVEIDIIYINDTKYNNFKLSVPKIYKFISDRRKEINGVQTTDEVTPTAEEQHTTGEEHEKTFTNPQKIKILDTLNIRGWLQDKGLTMFQIEVLLSDLFDISTKSIRNAMSNDIHSDFAENYIKELKQKKAKR
ncbi:hypothetical protein JZ948_09235 [Riemerella anatipestifer]|uniref:hypothetical protein n=1 Tax=Riemerella anatipestifer TaxID=34085 RepID=UPI0029671AAB|nr:hypothetical protein [Riemerella anatipestifer]MDW3557222.1 hypothetical protein [Riemerella anatipestifer]